MKKCPACGRPNKSYALECLACGENLSNICTENLSEKCELCGLGKSRKTSVDGKEQNLCYKCFVKKIMGKKYYAAGKNNKGSTPSFSNAIILYNKFLFLYQQALFYGDDI